MKIWQRCVVAVTALVAAMSAQADPVRIQVWHALSPMHQAVFDDLVARYNKEQKNVVVELSGAPSFETLEKSAIDAVREKRQPHLLQLPDNHAPEAVAQLSAVTPLHTLLAKHPVKDLRWFLPQTTSFVRDSKGRLMALPMMAEIPVLFYNRDLYQKAGINPDEIPQTWRDLQVQLVKLQQSGLSCPLATSRQVWIHQESLSAINGQPLATRNNGIDGGNTQLLVNDLLHVRHMSLMASWVRSRLLTQSSDDREGDTLFGTGQCAVLLSGTGTLAQLEHAKFSRGVAPLPHYDDVTRKPGTPFVGGSSMWVLSGHPAAEQKAVAQFIAWLVTPTVAAEWHQRTGFLPLTEAAARASDVSFYQRNPGAQALVTSMAGTPSPNSRGFRLANYSSVRNILNEETTAVLAGRKPALQGQMDAVQRAQAVLGKPAAPAPRKGGK